MLNVHLSKERRFIMKISQQLKAAMPKLERLEINPESKYEDGKVIGANEMLYKVMDVLDRVEIDRRKVASIIRVYSGWDIGEEDCFRISEEISLNSSIINIKDKDNGTLD